MNEQALVFLQVVLGNSGSVDHAASQIWNLRFDSAKGSHLNKSVHFLNGYSLSCLLKDQKVAQSMRFAAIVFPDGHSIIRLGQLLGVGSRRAQVVPGPDLFDYAMSSPWFREAKHLIVGTDDDRSREYLHRLNQQFSNCPKVQLIDPGLLEVTPTWLESIRSKVDDADFVWLALGTPKQDLAANDFAAHSSSVFLAIGAAFDFAVGRQRRAPKVIRLLKIEWLYRLSSNPSRLLKRYVISQQSINCALMLWPFLSMSRRRNSKLMSSLGHILSAEKV